jgi:hypothetical protein
MTRRLLLALFVLVLACDDAPKPQPQVLLDGVQIEAVPNDWPSFTRAYSKVLSGGITVTVKRHTSEYESLGRRSDGTLTQSDGRWVLFEPEKVADKILDRDIAARVQAFADEVLRLDREYIASKPDTFVDKNGTTWKRVQP